MKKRKLHVKSVWLKFLLTKEEEEEEARTLILYKTCNLLKQLCDLEVNICVQVE